ncbi:hypothetical protein QBC46DRAFT_387592 [Diplogelasinospora grovesii]|uniref:Endosomal spry domain-containing protein n=1 Tax=Diplogelasinospora grovesii TaxID=303347 RepID=A0AAN6N719_9PEZI|nr:hypothetical protein QBC46DRAFT_387592 [Diplogelasinospora grovesii]
MAPVLIKTLLSRTTTPPLSDIVSLGPLEARSILVARDGASSLVERDGGMVRPQDINNNAIFALFGLLGVAFVCTGIWFFFWAKNGGFHFKEDDWDDYKSTVLRRKGPNGTILSGATPSTILGGGSVYKDVDDGTVITDGNDLTTVVSGTTGITGITGGVSDIVGREKRRKKREQKEREKERRREEKSRDKEEKRKKRRKVGPDGLLIDEEAEAMAREQLRNYRHEKPARVGGLNKESEGSQWDGSTNPSYSQASGSGYGSSMGTSTVDSGSTVTSELINNRERTPTSTPTKKKSERKSEKEPEMSEKTPAAEKTPKSEQKKTGGIRKVYSTADKNDRREAERIRAEARKLQETGRAAAAAAERERSSKRRDFSWSREADENKLALRRIDERSEVLTEVTESVAEPSRAQSRHSRVPGGWNESEAGGSGGARSEVSGSGSGSGSGVGSELGTKVYRHSVHIPTNTSVSDFASNTSSYAEEKRKKRGGAGHKRVPREGGSQSGV